MLNVIKDYCHKGLLFLRIIVLLLCPVFPNINKNCKFRNFPFDTIHYCINTDESIFFNIR